MNRSELSIDGNNRAAAIRYAVIDAMPDDCHSCPEALNHSYDIGQFARATEMDPEAAADMAWGRFGACCKHVVTLELLTPLSTSPVSVSLSEPRVLVPA